MAPPTRSQLLSDPDFLALSPSDQETFLKRVAQVRPDLLEGFPRAYTGASGSGVESKTPGTVTPAEEALQNQMGHLGLSAGLTMAGGGLGNLPKVVSALGPRLGPALGRIMAGGAYGGARAGIEGSDVGEGAGMGAAATAVPEAILSGGPGVLNWLARLPQVGRFVPFGRQLRGSPGSEEAGEATKRYLKDVPLLYNALGKVTKTRPQAVAPAEATRDVLDWGRDINRFPMPLTSPSHLGRTAADVAAQQAPDVALGVPSSLGAAWLKRLLEGGSRGGYEGGYGGG